MPLPWLPPSAVSLVVPRNAAVELQYECTENQFSGARVQYPVAPQGGLPAWSAIPFLTFLMDRWAQKSVAHAVVHPCGGLRLWYLPDAPCESPPGWPPASKDLGSAGGECRSRDMWRPWHGVRVLCRPLNRTDPRETCWQPASWPRRGRSSEGLQYSIEIRVVTQTGFRTVSK